MVGSCGALSSSIAQANSALRAFRRLFAAPGVRFSSSRRIRILRGNSCATGFSASFSQIRSKSPPPPCLRTSVESFEGLTSVVQLAKMSEGAYLRCFSSPGLLGCTSDGGIVRRHEFIGSESFLDSNLPPTGHAHVKAYVSMPVTIFEQILQSDSHSHSP